MDEIVFTCYLWVINTYHIKHPLLICYARKVMMMFLMDFFKFLILICGKKCALFVPLLIFSNWIIIHFSVCFTENSSNSTVTVLKERCKSRNPSWNIGVTGRYIFLFPETSVSVIGLYDFLVIHDPLRLFCSLNYLCFFYWNRKSLQ